jgi:hypothetical protein
MDKVNAKKIMLILLLLAGCGPQIRTDYQWIAPQTRAGQMCASNCLYQKQQCEQPCAVEKSRCEAYKNAESQTEYMLQAYDRLNEGKSVTRSPSYTGYSKTCRREGNYCNELCGDNYRLCFTNCGGQIISNTRCVAKCD